MTITMTKMVERAAPNNRVRCGLALKLRRRYKSGVSNICIDSSSAKIFQQENTRIVIVLGPGCTHTFVYGILKSYGSLRSKVQRRSTQSMEPNERYLHACYGVATNRILHIRLMGNLTSILETMHNDHLTKNKTAQCVNELCNISRDCIVLNCSSCFRSVIDVL